MSNKEDTVISILAEKAVLKEYQVLSFDLPEHGSRKGKEPLCKAQICVEELKDIIAYAKSNWVNISVFACSMGAYFSMLAYRDEKINKCLFLSPVLDMKKVIDGIMVCDNVTEKRLEKEQTISTSFGPVLYWDYYSYVKGHPIDNWNKDTHILAGSKDSLCANSEREAFADKFNCDSEVMIGGEHFFHTEKQLETLKEWLDKKIV
jgi:hypothetical protein